MKTRILSTLLATSLIISLTNAEPNLSDNNATNKTNSNVNLDFAGEQNNANSSVNSSSAMNSSENSNTNLDLNSSVASENSAYEKALKPKPSSLQKVQIPSFEIISKQDFKQLGADNAFEVLRRTSGVFAREAMGYDAINRLFVRGLENKGIYIDGVPLRNVYNDENNLAFLTAKGLSQIELYKGFVSAYFAPTNSAVNLVSYKPQNAFEFNAGYKLFFNNVGVQDGTDYKQGENNHATQKYMMIGTRGESYFVQALYSDTGQGNVGFSKDYDNTIEAMRKRTTNGHFENRSLKLEAGWLTNDDEYSLHYINQKGSKGNFRLDPVANQLTGGISYNIAGIEGEYPVYDSQVVYFLGKSFFTPNFSLNSRLFYESIDKKWIQTNLRTGVILDDSEIRDYNSDIYGGNFAFDYGVSEFSALKFGASLTHIGHKNAWSKETLYESKRRTFDIKEWQSRVFGEFDSKIGDFGLIINTSYDRSDITKAKAELAMPPQETLGDLSDEKHSAGRKFSFGNLSLQALASYELSKAQSLYVSVAKKNELPNLYDRYFATLNSNSNVLNLSSNSNLRPESILSYELGYTLNLNSVNLNAALFYNDMRDMLGVKATNSGYELTNDYAGYIYGGELGAEFIIQEIWTLGGNYSFTQGWLRNGDSAGHKFIYYPHHSANAKLALKPVKAFEIVAFGTYRSGEKMPTNAGYHFGREYFSLDLLANYEIYKGLSVNAGILNISDRDNYFSRYDTTINSRVDSSIFNYHLAGRRYFIGFDFKYQK